MTGRREAQHRSFQDIVARTGRVHAHPTTVAKMRMDLVVESDAGRVARMFGIYGLGTVQINEHSHARRSRVNRGETMNTTRLLAQLSSEEVER